MLTDAYSITELASSGSVVEVEVPNEYETDLQAAVLRTEIYAIQKLLTLARSRVPLHVSWQTQIAEKVVSAPSLYPTLAVLLSLQQAQHDIEGKSAADLRKMVDLAREKLFTYRISADLFSDCQVVICADSRGQSFPLDLYADESGKLRPKIDFETLILELTAKHVGGSVQDSTIFRNARALAVVVAELFENTDMHARLGLDGKPLRPDAMRGLLLKRIKIARPPPPRAPRGTAPILVDCIEIGIFDSGVGYYPTYSKCDLTDEVDLKHEWEVLHNCLERHYYPGLEDNRAGHRAMGLAEVIRAVQALKGRIEFRTGRLFAYRTFLDGELQTQMEKPAPMAHMAWPKPRLLDVGKTFLAVPSWNEPIVGVAVRVVVPLE
ncbi:MAG: hypothetical protein H0X13_10080 [Ramlibacter sp.]|nr:hypothetical protein [Ramlibacter sp.]